MNFSRSCLCGGLAASFVLAGCLADDPQRKPQQLAPYAFEEVTPGDVYLLSEDVRMPAAGWSWEELAVRAGEKARRTGPGTLDVLVELLKTAEDTAWKDPELRCSFDFGKDKDKPGQLRHDDGRSYSQKIGARFFIPNPFINRYLRRKGEAAVARSKAKAALEAYGVYTEVRQMCREAACLDVQIARCRETDALLRRGKEIADAARRDGAVVSPYDTIRMRAETERNKLKIGVLERHRRQLHRLIASAADVAFEGFKLAPFEAALPDPVAMSADALVEMAFARRPDLAMALAELDEAEAGVGAAKAARIPWFNFVEAGYQHKSGTEDSYEEGLRSGKTTTHGDEGYVQVALSLPVFTWQGESVEMNRRVRDAADKRVQDLYASIRTEVKAALEHYRDVVAAVDPEEVESFAVEMMRQINEAEDSGAGVASASHKARLELNDFLEFAEGLEAAAWEAAAALESVVGGPTGAPARPRKAEAEAEPEGSSL